jgi:hypothetical protein
MVDSTGESNRGTGPLGQDLANYSIASKSYASRRLGKWELFAAAAGSALALTTSLDASIISGIVNRVATPGHAATFDIDGDGFKVQVNFSAFTSGVGAYESARLVALSPNARVLGTVSANFVYGNGISIRSYGTSQAILRLNGLASTFTFNVGDFPNNGTGYAGVNLLVSGAWRPGWIRLRMENFGAFNGSEKVNVIDWAYNNGGNTIPAGYVPEPGTLSLSLLALGSAGVLALRRRKKN